MFSGYKACLDLVNNVLFGTKKCLLKLVLSSRDSDLNN